MSLQKRFHANIGNSIANVCEDTTIISTEIFKRPWKIYKNAPVKYAQLVQIPVLVT